MLAPAPKLAMPVAAAARPPAAALSGGPPVRRRAGSALVVLALAAIAAIAAPALPAAPPPRPPWPPDLEPAPEVPPSVPSRSVPVEPDAVRLEGLGLSIKPPLGAVVARERTQDAVNLVMADRAESPRWRVRIQALEASPRTPTSRMIVQDHLNRLQAAGERFEILAFEPVNWGGSVGDLLVVEQLLADDTRTVNGWLVLPRGGRDHTVFTLATTAEHVVDARAALESSLATLVLSDLDELFKARHERLARGQAFIDTLTEERLRTLLGIDQWFRLHRPDGAGGDRELGYVHLHVIEAMRGELDPQRAPGSLRGDEAEPGLLLIAKARGLMNESGSEVLDIESRYWLAWDRRSEAWSSRSTERRDRVVRGFAQTGVRPPSRPGAGSTLTVVTARSDRGRDASNPTESWDLPAVGYLSVPEAMLLGWLLPRESDAEGEYGFYAFDTKEGRVTLRRDDWRAGESGQWTLTTQPMSDEPVSRQVFAPDRTRVRLVDGDGTRSEAIELAALFRLWASKGLPTGEGRP